GVRFAESEMLNLIAATCAALGWLHTNRLVHGAVDRQHLVREGIDWKLLPSAKMFLNRGDSASTKDDVQALCAIIRRLIETGQCLPDSNSNRLAKLMADFDLTRARQPALELLGSLVGRPSAIANLRGRREPRRYRLAWDQPAIGDVRVVVTETLKPHAASGALILPCQVPGSSLEVAVADTNAVEIELPPKQDLVAVPYTIHGTLVAVGCRHLIGSIADVEGVQVSVEDRRMKVTWKWPKGVEFASVAWRRDRFPISAEEPGTQHTRIAKTAYRASAGYSEPWLTRTGVVFLTVFAAEKDGPSWRYSGGTASGSRSKIPLERCGTLRYRLVKVPFRHGVEITLQTDAPVKLPELVLVGKQDYLPVDRNDGRELWRSKPIQLQDQLILRFDCDHYNKKLHTRLFTIREEDSEWLKLIPL
ncbi:MAG: hypothetical protein MI861_13360, partial [Pirellulales bacterium]|nr:hypothetical protein [Pirellulales bacterium]